jgi:hypothetical protein
MFAMLFLLAADPPAQASAPPAAVQKPAVKMECRNIMEPGSRIPSRVCKSPEEWEQLAKETQDDLNSARTRRGAGAINPE